MGQPGASSGSRSDDPRNRASAVSQYVRTIAGSGRMPVPPKARRRLRLGYTEDGREFRWPSAVGMC